MKNKKVIVALLLLVAILFFSRGLFFAATVNGKPISRLSIIQDLESKVGKQMLESYITNELISQEAVKKKIRITTEEKEKKIKEIDSSAAKQGQKLEELLKIQGIPKDDFEKQVELQLILEKILADKIKVSDKEIDAQIKQLDQLSSLDSATSTSPTPTPPNRSDIRTQLRQQKLQVEGGKYVEEIKKKAKINYFVQY